MSKTLEEHNHEVGNLLQEISSLKSMLRHAGARLAEVVELLPESEKRDEAARAAARYIRAAEL